ncbi:phage head spike fiber domain-containing protein [Aeromonas veronii]|uniref:phage head spike fiber domain-containing protein n=1 Tax=Aeromonas veronii TaxID=654 RepID=UPI003D22C4BA
MAGVWKRDGTVAVTNGSKKVTGTGTTFADAKNGVAKGHLFCMTTGTTVDLYEVDYVVSNTELHLVQAFRGTTGTGKAYEIITTFSDSIPEFARKLNSSLAYYQSQSDMVQQLFTSDAAEITVTAPDGTTHELIPWKRVTSEGEGQAARAKIEADKAAVSASAAASAVLAARLPVPDVSIPFTTDGQLLHGKGTPVLVGTTPVAQLVSYERLGSQTMLDKSGRLVTVPAGEMAIEQQGLAIFDQSVNLAGPSINWAASANAAAPWAHSAKDEFGWISVSGSGDPSKAEGSYKDFSVPTVDTPHTLSLDILKTAGLNVKLRTYGTATDTTVDVTITETAVSGSGGSDVYDMGHYWRVELTRTFTGATKHFRIYPFGPNIGSAGSMSYRRVQLEAKPFATPYIENETSAKTTRPATTRCDIPWSGNLQPISDNQQLTIALEFDTAGIPLVGISHTLFTQGGGIGQHVMGRVENGGLLRFYRSAGATHQTSVSSRRRYRICFRVNRNVCDLFIDGIKFGSTVTAIPAASGLNDVLRLGCSLTPDRCLNGHLRSISIWSAPLTDIQCQAASS